MLRSLGLGLGLETFSVLENFGLGKKALFWSKFGIGKKVAVSVSVKILVASFSASDTKKQILNAFSTNIVSLLHPVYYDSIMPNPKSNWNFD